MGNEILQAPLEDLNLKEFLSNLSFFSINLFRLAPPQSLKSENTPLLRTRNIIKELCEEASEFANNRQIELHVRGSVDNKKTELLRDLGESIGEFQGNASYKDMIELAKKLIHISKSIFKTCLQILNYLINSRNALVIKDAKIIEPLNSLKEVANTVLRKNEIIREFSSEISDKTAKGAQFLEEIRVIINKTDELINSINDNLSIQVLKIPNELTHGIEDAQIIFNTLSEKLSELPNDELEPEGLVLRGNAENILKEIKERASSALDLIKKHNDSLCPKVFESHKLMNKTLDLIGKLKDNLSEF